MILTEIGRTVRSFASTNVGLKVLSFGCALILYSLAHGAQDAQRTVMVNVVALTPPEGMNRVLGTPLPPQLRATLRGPRMALDDIRLDDIGNVQVDIRDGGVSRVTFDPASVLVPPGVKVEQVDPPAVDLTWEDSVSREIPVQVSVIGAPAAGFVVKSPPAASPLAVRARGPASEVAVIQHLRVEAFDVEGLGEGKYTRPLAIDRRGGRVSFDSASVEVTIVIGRKVSDRAFARLPIAVLGPAKAHAQPSEVDVRVSCPPEIVGGLRAEQIVPRARVVSPLEHGSDAFPVEVTLERCDVRTIPETVVVRW